MSFFTDCYLSFSTFFKYLSIYLSTYNLYQSCQIHNEKKNARQRITLQLCINNFPPLKIVFIISYWKKYLLSQNMYCCLVAQLCPILCDPMDYSIPGFPVLHHHLPEFAQTHVIETVMPSNHLILCRPLLLMPSIFPSIGVFSQWVNSSHQMAKVLEL